MISVVSLNAIVPIVIKQLPSSLLDATLFAAMIVFFVFLALQGIDRIIAKVTLGPDGLSFRGLWRRTKSDWPDLCVARTLSIRGVLYYVIGDSNRHELWVPCADSKVRLAIGEMRIRRAIHEKG